MYLGVDDSKNAALIWVLPSFSTHTASGCYRQRILTLIVLPTEAFTAGCEARRYLLLLVALAERLAQHWHHAGQDLSLGRNLRRRQVNQSRLSLTHLLVKMKPR